MYAHSKQPPGSYVAIKFKLFKYAINSVNETQNYIDSEVYMLILVH